jgi:hypothetical protein
MSEGPPRLKVKGLKMPRLATPRPANFTHKGQVPLNPYSGNKMVVKRADGPLTAFLHLREELEEIRSEQIKTASYDPLPFFFAFLKEASIPLVQGGLKAAKIVGGAIKGGVKPTLQQVKAVVPDVATATQAGKGMATGGGNLRVVGSGGKSRRKFLRKQMLAQQTGVAGAGSAGASNINVGIREGLKKVPSQGLAPVVAAPQTARGASMVSHVEGVGARNVPVLKGRAASPVAAATESRTAARLSEMAKKRGLNPEDILSAHREGGLGAAMAKLKAANPGTAIVPAKGAPLSKYTTGQKMLGAAALTAGVGVPVVGGGIAANKGIQYANRENAYAAQTGYNQGIR